MLRMDLSYFAVSVSLFTIATTLMQLHRPPSFARFVRWDRRVFSLLPVLLCCIVWPSRPAYASGAHPLAATPPDGME